MKYEVDQSIRIEKTNQDTIIGLANHKESIALIIPAKTKRTLQEHFRRQGLTKKYVILIFTASIILAVEKSKFKIQELIIDIEYPGHEEKIIKHIKNYFKDKFEVYFSLIGKHSPAHLSAYGVHTKRRKSNYKTNTEEINKIIQKMTSGL